MFVRRDWWVSKTSGCRCLQPLPPSARPCSCRLSERWRRAVQRSACALRSPHPFPRAVLSHRPLKAPALRGSPAQLAHHGAAAAAAVSNATDGVKMRNMPLRTMPLNLDSKVKFTKSPCIQKPRATDQHTADHLAMGFGAARLNPPSPDENPNMQKMMPGSSPMMPTTTKTSPRSMVRRTKRLRQRVQKRLRTAGMTRMFRSCLPNASKPEKR